MPDMILHVHQHFAFSLNASALSIAAVLFFSAVCLRAEAETAVAGA
jgi:hypothetical protein